MSTVRLRGSPGIRGCGSDVATHHVPCHVATRHPHGHVHGSATISTEPVGSAPDTVHVLRFPTYVRSRVRRLNGHGVPYPEHGYVRNRHDASLNIAVNVATALSFRKLVASRLRIARHVDKVEDCLSEA